MHIVFTFDLHTHMHVLTLQKTHNVRIKQGTKFQNCFQFFEKHKIIEL